MSNYPICLAAYSIDEDRIWSSSGGIFAEIAKVVLDRSGVVFGAAIDTDGKVFHKYITKKEELYDLLGSKYVQSDLGTSFSDVRKFLRDNRLVLFCGTPCQTEGLLSFLGKRPDNLIVVDFICHGVPSFKVFHNYLKEISNEREVEKIYFRDKEKGWADYSFRIEYKNGEVYKRIFNLSNYMYGFIYDLYLRPSCYDCPFKGINRKTDITLGDFWGITEEEPEFYDRDGVSVLLLHNEKSKQLIDLIGDKIKSKLIQVDEVAKHNPSLIKPSDKNIMRGLFFFEMKKGVSYTVEGIKNPNIIQKVRNKLYRGAYKRLTAYGSSKTTEKSFAKKDSVPVLYTNKEKCCGCSACINICPKNTIKMKEDKEGFMYPVIDKSNCIGCRNCIRVCPISGSDRAPRLIKGEVVNEANQ